MILLVSAVLIISLTVLFTLSVRSGDIPQVEPISPVQHLEDRRAAIYENLRDLQFEFRVGKLSEADYQHSKLGLQKELAGVLAEMERISGVAPAPPATPSAETDGTFTCPHCGAEFPSAMKFCGSCGKAPDQTPDQANDAASTSAKTTEATE